MHVRNLADRGYNASSVGILLKYENNNPDHTPAPGRSSILLYYKEVMITLFEKQRAEDINQVGAESNSGGRHYVVFLFFYVYFFLYIVIVLYDNHRNQC